MRRTVVAAALLMAALGVPLLVGLNSCASRGEDERAAAGRRITVLPQPGPELSEELMIALSLARNYHHKADALLKDARVDQAVESVRQILSIPFPAGSPEGEDVMTDARARLAKLLVTRGALDEALTVVDGGLARAERQSFFVANLHTVRGEVMEARAARLDDDDRAGAAAARRLAIESYDRAIAIEKALLRQLPGGEVE